MNNQILGALNKASKLIKWLRTMTMQGQVKVSEYALKLKPSDYEAMREVNDAIKLLAIKPVASTSLEFEATIAPLDETARNIEGWFKEGENKADLDWKLRFEKDGCLKSNVLTPTDR